MATQKSLDSLAAFEHEEAAKQTHRPAAFGGEVTRALTAVTMGFFEVVPTAVSAWRGLTPSRRGRMIMVTVVLLVLQAVVGLGLLGWRNPGVRKNVVAASDTVRATCTTYLARTRAWLASEEEVASAATALAKGSAEPGTPQVSPGGDASLVPIEEKNDAEDTAEPGMRQKSPWGNPNLVPVGVKNKLKGKGKGKGRGKGKREHRMASLTSDLIVKTVRKKYHTVTSCLRLARSGGEIPPGRYTFVFSWVIQPNGSVIEPVMSKPAFILGSSLPGCFAAKMRRWKFPKTKSPSRVNNFPMPISVQ